MLHFQNSRGFYLGGRESLKAEEWRNGPGEEQPCFLNVSCKSGGLQHAFCICAQGCLSPQQQGNRKDLTLYLPGISCHAPLSIGTCIFLNEFTWLLSSHQKQIEIKKMSRHIIEYVRRNAERHELKTGYLMHLAAGMEMCCFQRWHRLRGRKNQRKK